MKISSIKMPSAKFDIINNSDGYSAVFYENIAESKDIDCMTGQEITVWEYETYTLPVTNTANLYASIASNFDEWIQKAKNYELDQESEKIRVCRDKLLNDCDTIYCNAANWALMNDAEKAQWQAYKQVLRDIPEGSGFPYIVTFPKIPK